MSKLKVIFTSAFLLVILAVSQFASAGDKKDRAITGWAFVFNDASQCDGIEGCDGPDLCAAGGAVIYLTGQRVQKNGRVTFAGQISADSLHRVIGPPPCPANGLTHPMTAEIHVGLDDHGIGSLDGNADSVHAEVTNPGAGTPGIRQFAAFMPGALDGVVFYAGTTTIVPGSSARMTRDSKGVSISIDTNFDLNGDN